jgi:hypothetical protein
VRDEREEEFLVRVERGRKLVASEFRRAARAEDTVAAAGVGGSGSKMPPARRPFQPLPATDTADDAVSVEREGDVLERFQGASARAGPTPVLEHRTLLSCNNVMYFLEVFVFICWF